MSRRYRPVILALRRLALPGEMEAAASPIDEDAFADVHCDVYLQRLLDYPNPEVAASDT